MSRVVKGSFEWLFDMHTFFFFLAMSKGFLTLAFLDKSPSNTYSHPSLYRCSPLGILSKFLHRNAFVMPHGFFFELCEKQ